MHLILLVLFFSVNQVFATENLATRAGDLSPIRLSGDNSPPEAFELSEPNLNFSEETKKQINRPLYLRLTKRLGVVDTEVKVAPLQRQTQLEGNIDLMRLTEEYRKEKLLRKKCTYNPEKCEKLNELLLKRAHDDAISPQIKNVISDLKKVPEKVYKIFKAEF